MDGGGSTVGELKGLVLYGGGGICHTRGSKFHEIGGGQQAL